MSPQSQKKKKEYIYEGWNMLKRIRNKKKIEKRKRKLYHSNYLHVWNWNTVLLLLYKKRKEKQENIYTTLQDT